MPTRICPTCLKIAQVDDDMDYCPYCGAAYPGSRAAAPPASKKSKESPSMFRAVFRNPIVFWTCVAYLLAFIVAVGVLILIWWLSQIPTPGPG